MASAFEHAARDWHREVDEEAARLIEGGTPPFDAMTRARDTVQRRRQQRARIRPTQAPEVGE